MVFFRLFFSAAIEYFPHSGQTEGGRWIEINRFMDSAGDCFHLDSGVTFKSLIKSDTAGIHLLASFVQAEKQQRPFIIPWIIIMTGGGRTGGTGSVGRRHNGLV